MPKLSVVETPADGVAPAVLSFPSGKPPAAALEAGAHEGGLQLHMLRNSGSARKSKQVELRAETETMRYVGAAHGREGKLAQAGGTVVLGCYHKRSGTVKLLPMPRVFVMKPSIKAPLVPLEPPAEGESRANLGATKRKLVAELGSAKALKKQRANAARIIDAEAVYNQDDLEADVSGALAAARPAAARSQQEMHPLHPPFDLQATSVADAYPLAGIVPAPVWSTLEHKALRDAAEAGDAVLDKLRKDPEGMTPRYVIERLARPLPSDKEARKQLLRGLCYLTYLVRFSRTAGPIDPPRAGKAASSEHPVAKKLNIPPPAWEQLLRDFTEEGVGGFPDAQPVAGRRRLTPPRKDKLCLHTLALALHLTGGSLPCAALAADLKLTEEKTTFYLRQLGCVLQKRAGSKEKLAQLKLPLTFPKLARGGGQRP
jgi:hypothetical protein